MTTPCRPLLVALDVPSAARALQLAEELGAIAGGFKVGNRLFTAEGPSIVRALTDRGARVFLDLKYHDIPNIVAGAVAAATRLGAWMVTVHASGGSAMLRAAAASARETAAATGLERPLVVGVTVLTSLDDEALDEVGMQTPVASQVERLALLAERAGLDGVVASPQELPLLRQRCGAGFAIVTPGIRPMRPGGIRIDDQARTLSAAEAMQAGADFLVVGRPITGADDPRAAAEEIAAGIEQFISNR